MTVWWLVFFGGGLGSVCRYAISNLVQRYFDSTIPLATFFSNVLSCVLLVLIVGLAGKAGENKLVHAGVLIGFCGGFSTFSTFSFETIQLIKNGNHLVAAGNVILSVGVCLILIYKLTK